MAKKGARVMVTLECTEARKEGKPPSRYTTTKNKQKNPERLELKLLSGVGHEGILDMLPEAMAWLAPYLGR